MDKYETLKYYFGHDSFRPGQELLIDALLNGQDALGIMPTGAGKSMCYQVPALMLEGITLVISPLISLMKDQVAALKAAGVPAAYFNSSLTPYQLDLATERARQGAYKIIYVAPERLETHSFRAFACTSPISMVAVDEAHCVSQWGQDFRPNYLKIADFIDLLPKRPRVGAFTATATERVKNDIMRLLRLDHPATTTTGFDRPNLFFEVTQPKSKYAALQTLLSQKRGQSGIVYCATRKTVEEVTDKLAMAGFAVSRYHAGLSDEERARNQEDFQYDRVQVMVATNAFGMGIDKSNVNYVVHYNMPKSMEAYYQEAGRAGRDGEPAECILFYSGQDVITGKWMIEHSEPNPEMTAAEQALVRKQDMDRLFRMISYCTKSDCLRADILQYFGQQSSGRCGACSRCTGGHWADLNGMEKLPRSRKARQKADDWEIRPITAKPKQVAASSFYDDGSEILLPMKAGVRLGHMQDAPADDVPKNDTLFEHLRIRRLEISRSLHVPPYVVATDAALEDMARRRPHTLDAMLNVYGMGTAKVGKFGQQFLDAVAEWERKHPEAASPAGKTKTVVIPSTGLPKKGKADGPSSARAASAAKHEVAYQPWTDEEEERLRRGYLAGVSVDQLSAIHGRTKGGIRSRLKRMGLIFDAKKVERYGVAAYEEDEDDNDQE